MEKTLRFSWKKSHEKLCRCHQSIGKSHENHPLTVDLRPWQWWVTRFQPFDLEISFPRRGSVSWQGKPSMKPADGWGKPFSRWKSSFLLDDFHPKICSSKSCEARAHPGETCASWVMRGVWASEKNLAKFRFQKQMLCPIGKYLDWFMSSTWMNFHKPRSVPCEFFAEVMDFLLSDPEAGSSSS